MKKFLDNSIESLSLTFFLIYIHLIDIKARADWLWPYLFASILGLAAIIYLYKKRIVLNRIFLGGTLYFCSGFLGLLVGWDWLNQTYAELEAVAMLYWIIGMGIISIVSPYGFLGIKSVGRFSKMQASLLLLLSCLIATVIATFFINNTFLGQWLPFIFIFSTRSLLLHIDKKPFESVTQASN
jgi:hypothetical protein